MMAALIVIPARMKATRLPGKPLAELGGVPMIVQVMRRAVESGVGEVVVACDGQEIADAVTRAGGHAVITDPNHPSGSDRVWEAVCRYDVGLSGTSVSESRSGGVSAESAKGQRAPSGMDVIINLQGDLPTLDPALLNALLRPLRNPEVDIATLVAPITRADEHENPSVVKAVIALESGADTGRALYFTRAAAPYGDGVRYHHIGVYAYRRAALERFVSLPPSPLEQREKLEQLRALEAGMRVDAVVVDTVPLGVDTPEDLERARHILG